MPIMIDKRLAAVTAVAALLATAPTIVRAQAAMPDQSAPPTAPTAPGPAAPDQTAPPVATTSATPAPVFGPPPPPEQPRPRFRIGPAIGIFLPSSGKTRDRFGDAWFSIGIGLGAINSVRTNGTVALDANLFYHSRDSNHAFFLPIGLGYRIALSSPSRVTPYAGASVDVNFSDITSNPDNIHNSFQVGAGGSAFVGVNFGDSAFLEARYLELSHANGFDLSGLNLSAGYRF